MKYIKRLYLKFKYRKIKDKYFYQIIDKLQNNKIINCGERNFYDIIFLYELLPTDTGFYVEKIER